MVSLHGYVSVAPPVGATDSSSQTRYVLELSKMLSELGYAVDIWMRRMEDQTEIDVINDLMRIIRIPCGGLDFLPREELWRHLPEWSDLALEHIGKTGVRYEFFNSHYWDAGMAAQFLSAILNVPHIHTPHTLGIWQQHQLENKFPGRGAVFETQYHFQRQIMEERRLYGDCDLVVALNEIQLELLSRDYDVPSDKLRLAAAFAPEIAPPQER